VGKEYTWDNTQTEVLAANADSLNLAIMKKQKNQASNKLSRDRVQDLRSEVDRKLEKVNISTNKMFN
jgi:hypothetical protein